MTVIEFILNHICSYGKQGVNNEILKKYLLQSKSTKENYMIRSLNNLQQSIKWQIIVQRNKAKKQSIYDTNEAKMIC